MKMSKFKIAVLVLLVVAVVYAVVYAVAFIQSAMAYQSWKHESFLQWCNDMGISPDSQMADFAPDYKSFGLMNPQLYACTLLALTFCWFAVMFFHNRNKN
jgi:hypothetical protein